MDFFLGLGAGAKAIRLTNQVEKQSSQHDHGPEASKMLRSSPSPVTPLQCRTDAGIHAYPFPFPPSELAFRIHKLCWLAGSGDLDLLDPQSGGEAETKDMAYEVVDLLSDNDIP